MAESVEWDDIEPQRRGSSGGSGKFLKLEANQKYKVRPVGKPVKFVKFGNFNGAYKSVVVAEKDVEMVKSKYPKLRLQNRRAMVVFWKDGEGSDVKVRIVEGPTTMFEAFKHFVKLAKKQPGGKEGGDFIIEVDCPSGKKDRDTKYTIEFDKDAPFTEAERAYFSEHKAEYDLQEIFKPVSLEELEEKLFGDGNSNDNRSTNSNTQKKQSDDDMGMGSSNDSPSDDDLMNW